MSYNDEMANAANRLQPTELVPPNPATTANGAAGVPTASSTPASNSNNGTLPAASTSSSPSPISVSTCSTTTRRNSTDCGGAPSRKRKSYQVEDPTPDCSRSLSSADVKVPAVVSNSAESSVLQAGAFSLPAAGGDDVSPYDARPKRPRKSAKSRKHCLWCYKKLTLAATFICRCGGEFCTIHRYAETHECTFDYREHGRAQLIQSNPLVRAEKVPRI